MLVGNASIWSPTKNLYQKWLQVFFLDLGKPQRNRKRWMLGNGEAISPNCHSYPSKYAYFHLTFRKANYLSIGRSAWWQSWEWTQICLPLHSPRSPPPRRPLALLPNSSLPISPTSSGMCSENERFQSKNIIWSRQDDSLINFSLCFRCLLSKMEILIYFLCTVIVSIKYISNSCKST